MPLGIEAQGDYKLASKDAEKLEEMQEKNRAMQAKHDFEQQQRMAKTFAKVNKRKQQLGL